MPGTAGMATTDASTSHALADTFAWFLNVSSSVLIVFVNKVLLDAHSCAFTFATTLSALHFLACALSIWAVQALGLAKRAALPWKEVLLFSLVANISISSLNLSLLVNSVGTYQVAKLLIIPGVCVMELLWFNRNLTPAMWGAVAVVVCGVAVVTVNDVSTTPLGLVIAAISVVSSGLQQIMCGAIQAKHKVSSHQLLSNTAPVQGMMLLFAGPVVDHWVSGRDVLSYKWTQGALQQLMLSCGVAVAVNISQFMCLGRFSAVTFQVLGHSKTILVLLTSWIMFSEVMTLRKVLGMSLAVTGMVAYGWLGSRKNTGAVSAPGKTAAFAAAGGKAAPLRGGRRSPTAVVAQVVTREAGAARGRRKA